MTYIVSSGALNSTHSLTHSLASGCHFWATMYNLIDTKNNITRALLTLVVAVAVAYNKRTVLQISTAYKVFNIKGAAKM